MDYKIAAISDQPELAPLVAKWLLDAFGHPGSPTIEAMTAMLLPPRIEETFVLFEGDIPVGTASLTRNDLASRPDLAPWLADVVVQPAFRKRGYATALVRRVEASARAASVSTLWLLYLDGGAALCAPWLATGGDRAGQGRGPRADETGSDAGMMAELQAV